MRILIADDQRRTRQSLRLLLKTFPFILEVEEAANGQEAVRLVQEAQPDIVLMDARMPEMDGVEATRRIKAGWPGVKIILISMYPEYREVAIRIGADAFVSKGEPPEGLIDTISEMLSLGRQSSKPI